MTKQKLSPKTFLMFTAYAVMLVVCGGQFDGLFSFGVYVGMLYATNPIVISVMYLASSFLYGWQNVLHCAVRVGVMLLAVCVHHFVKRKISKGNLLLYVVLANVFYLVWQFTDYFALFDKVANVVCGVAFAFVSLYTVRAVFVRGIAYKMGLEEKICLCIFVMVGSFCLSKLAFFNLEMVYFFVPFAILFCASCIDDKSTFACAVIVGMGNLLATGSYDCLAFCCICALTVVAFCNVSRYLSALGVVIVDVAMSYFLQLHGNFFAIVFAPTLTSVLVFVVIPTSVFKRVNESFCGSETKHTGKSMYSRLMSNLSKRLLRLSDIFLTIKKTFFALSIQNVSQKEVVEIVVKQCCEQVCTSCTNRTSCWRQHLKTTEQCFVDLANVALSRGKCTILDIPQSLSVKCDRVAMLISNLNSQAEIFATVKYNNEQKQTNKLVVAQQMGGVSQLLLQLATDYKSNVNFDIGREKELCESLVFHNVLCTDALILTQGETLNVMLTVASKDVDVPTIEKCTSLIVKQSMFVERVESTQNPRFNNVSLHVKPRFGVTFGVACATKSSSQVSGDTHSQLFTDNGKCILSLCDGMGSGHKAEQMSNTVMNLLESFYRAGFDSDVILSTVNGLLAQSGNEVFCAMDIVALDLYNGFADFVKLGASVGLIKSGKGVEVICGSSLPLGILEEMKPSVTKKVLGTGDMVVLMSDGIADCFGDVKPIVEIFSATTYTNPQSVAETILSKAMRKCNNNPPDDMTVVVAKIV